MCVCFFFLRCRRPRRSTQGRASAASDVYKRQLPKLRIHRRGARQEVTGLTVNDRVSVPRVIRRRIRAALHHVNQGKEATWKGEPMSLESLTGHINFIKSVHPDLGQALFNSLPQ